MDMNFFERGSWFLDQARNRRYPNATQLSKIKRVSPKTAARIIQKLKSEFDAPLQYNRSVRGYELLDPEFKLPLLCRFTPEEIEALEDAIRFLKMHSKIEKAKILYRLLKRGIE